MGQKSNGIRPIFLKERRVLHDSENNSIRSAARDGISRKMDSGLDVYVLPKQGFNKTYATFTTKYGSVDNEFVPLGKDMIRVPDGIAHFLEHKLFEKEDGDVFHTFSKQGAAANAFTTFTRTAYLFSSTANVEQNLETLIDFVQEPYFTEKRSKRKRHHWSRNQHV